MPFKLGPMELGLILLIILMVFGVGKLPQVGASLGKAIRSFKQGAAGGDEEEGKDNQVKKKVTRARARKPAAKKESDIKTRVAAAEAEAGGGEETQEIV